MPLGLSEPSAGCLRGEIVAEGWVPDEGVRIPWGKRIHCGCRNGWFTGWPGSDGAQRSAPQRGVANDPRAELVNDLPAGGPLSPSRGLSERSGASATSAVAGQSTRTAPVGGSQERDFSAIPVDGF